MPLAVAQAVAQAVAAVGPLHVDSGDLGQSHRRRDLRCFTETEPEVVVEVNAGRLGPEAGNHVLQLAVLQHDQALSLAAVLAAHERGARCIRVCLEEGGGGRRRVVALGQLHDLLHHIEILLDDLELRVKTLRLFQALLLLARKCLLGVVRCRGEIADPARGLEYVTPRLVGHRIKLGHTSAGLTHRPGLRHFEDHAIPLLDLEFGLGLLYHLVEHVIGIADCSIARCSHRRFLLVLPIAIDGVLGLKDTLVLPELLLDEGNHLVRTRVMALLVLL
mmetsp:Transcript_148659/g.370410  ORF Transcript_148659/g.370410 Transcript_148659/m.370410 type:complete len:276 (-) Transcript_148659:194-1021(-)